MLSFLTSFAASSSFEKSRLEITAKTYQQPTQQAIRNIINTFRGNDSQTKAQIAYATIIKKIHTSDSKSNWLYLLKNLIIFDRVANQNLFCQELSGVSLEPIQNYKETDKKLVYLNTEKIIKSFWRLIRERCRKVATNQHIFCYKRTERSQYLSKLTAEQLVREIISIQFFFGLVFELVNQLTGDRIKEEKNADIYRISRQRAEFEQSRLLQYIYQQILQKLMFYYSCQLLCNSSFLQLLTTTASISNSMIMTYKKQISTFRANSNLLVSFIQKRKHIKGFQQINYRQLNPYQDEDVHKMIDQYLKHRSLNQTNYQLQYVGIKQQPLFVQRKPLNQYKNDSLIPRIKQKSQSTTSAANHFQNWINSYSSEFPQKEIMTVDLIQHLRAKQSGEDSSDDEQIISDLSSRFSCSVHPNIAYISGKKYQVEGSPKQISKDGTLFRNIYSSMVKKWNCP